MKLPEPLFAIINPVVKLLLKSPLHFLSSRSLMLITFTGRKSGREFTTPVRYVRTEETVRCFTSSENQWWRNLRGGADVVLRTEGQNAPYHAVVIENNPEEVKQQLQHYLALFPQDAAYHDIRLNNDKSLVTADLEAAARNAIVVEAHPIHQAV
jgi:deazaflavin-dependent oxidoreductase (nitroreductase family)